MRMGKQLRYFFERIFMGRPVRRNGGKQLSLFEDWNVVSNPTRESKTVKSQSSKADRTSEKLQELGDGDIYEIWLKLRRTWFPDRKELDSYALRFSKRKQTRTLACCDVFTRKVTVARELAYGDYRTWLVPLLYHEMCHAVLGSTARRTGKRRNLHGAEFKSLESLHPQINDLNQWIATGGWLKAIRSDRARRAAHKRTTQKRDLS